MNVFFANDWVLKIGRDHLAGTTVYISRILDNVQFQRTF